MSNSNLALDTIGQFVSVIQSFQKKYVDKKEININLIEVSEKIKEDGNHILKELKDDQDQSESKLKVILDSLEEIQFYKKNMNDLNYKVETEELDEDEYVKIDKEIQILKENIKKLNEAGLIVEREKLNKNFFDCKEIYTFFENILLFTNLLKSLVKIYEENIIEKDFDFINQGLIESDSVALKNMMELIRYNKYKNMPYEYNFINDFFTLEQFYTLLALSNNSLKFNGYEISQKDKYDIEKYFNLLKIQNLVFLILSRLCVMRNDQERKVAHYTTVDVGVKLATNISHVRLNSVDFMNDPTEGKILKDFLNLKYINDDNIHINTFLTCFTFNHNSLNQFRLYGNTDDIECSGLSLVFKNYFFAQGFEKATTSRIYYKLPLFRCIYLDFFSGYFEIARRNKFTFYQEYKDKNVAEKAWNKYINKINKVETIVKQYFDEMKKCVEILYSDNDLKVISFINNTVNPLRFLIKHFAFQEEQECRMMRIESIEHSDVIFDMVNNKSYIDYKLDVNEYLTNIYIGEKSKLNHTYLIKEISKKSEKIPKIRISDNPFRSAKKDFIYKK